MKRYSNDPRIITARYDSLCAETGRPIRKGETCIYYPLAGQVFCEDSKQAETFRSEQFDRDYLGAHY